MSKWVWAAAGFITVAAIGLVGLDQTQTFCVTEGCRAAVNETRVAAEAAEATQAAKRDAEEIGRKLNDLLIQQGKARKNTMDTLAREARDARRKAEQDEQTARSRMISLEPIYSGGGGAGFLAREEALEGIRALQVRTLDEQKKILATESEAFYLVPDQIDCPWSSGSCSELVAESLSGWQSNLRESESLASRVGLESSPPIAELSENYTANFDKVSSMIERLKALETTILAE